jgi:hypothetical protein
VVVAPPIGEVAAQEGVPLESGGRIFDVAIQLLVRLVGHRVTASLVLPSVDRGADFAGADHGVAVDFAVAWTQALGVPTWVEVSVSACPFDHRAWVSARSRTSPWRSTPHTGHRMRCARFSWYRPCGFRHSHCHAVGFSFIRRFGWTFELNTSDLFALRTFSTGVALVMQRWRPKGTSGRRLVCRLP